MLEGMVSAVAAIDAHDHIRSANAAFFKIFPEASVGSSVHDKFSSPDAMKMIEAAITSRVERSTYRGRWICGEDTPNCANRSFDVYSSPLEIDGDKGQIVTLVDVTEAAEAESVMRRTESLTAMGASGRSGRARNQESSRQHPPGRLDVARPSKMKIAKPINLSSAASISEQAGDRRYTVLRQRPLELSEVELHH